MAKKGEKKYIQITGENDDMYEGQIVQTIICEGDAIGAVIVLICCFSTYFANYFVHNYAVSFCPLEDKGILKALIFLLFTIFYPSICFPRKFDWGTQYFCTGIC